MSPYNYRVEGVILGRTNFAELDRILTVFSKEKGKIKVMAKGVRKITSRRGGSLDLFNWVLLSLSRGRTFGIVTEVELIDSFPTLREQLELVGQAYYLVELVDKLCPEGQANKRVFELLTGALTQVANCQSFGESLIVRNFEVNLLKALGYWSPSLEKVGDLRYYIEGIIEKPLKSVEFLKGLDNA